MSLPNPWTNVSGFAQKGAAVTTDDIDEVDIRVGVPATGLTQVMSVLQLGTTVGRTARLLLFVTGQPLAHASAARPFAAFCNDEGSATDRMVVRVRLQQQSESRQLGDLVRAGPGHSLRIVEEWTRGRRGPVGSVMADAGSCPDGPTSLQREVLAAYGGVDGGMLLHPVPIQQQTWRIRHGFVDLTARLWVSPVPPDRVGQPYRGFELSRFTSPGEAPFILPALESLLRRDGLDGAEPRASLEFAATAALAAGIPRPRG